MIQPQSRPVATSPREGLSRFSRFNRRRESLSSELRDGPPRLLSGSETSTPNLQQPEDTYVLLRQSYKCTERTKSVQCVGAGKRHPGYFRQTRCLTWSHTAGNSCLLLLWALRHTTLLAFRRPCAIRPQPENERGLFGNALHEQSGRGGILQH